MLIFTEYIFVVVIVNLLYVHFVLLLSNALLFHLLELAFVVAVVDAVAGVYAVVPVMNLLFLL